MDVKRAVAGEKTTEEETSVVVKLETHRVPRFYGDHVINDDFPIFKR